VASIYKRRRRKPIPDGAEIVSDKRGRKFATWLDKQDRRRRAPLSDDGKQIVVEDDFYTVAWFDWTGRRCREVAGKDHDGAEALGRLRETEARQRRQGLIDPAQERHAAEARRPILEHVGDFKAHLVAKRVSAGEVQGIVGQVTRIIEGCRFLTLSGITASAVHHWLGELRAEGRSARTSNDYLQSIKQFARWLLLDRRIAHNPVAHLRPVDERKDRHHDRRPLSPEEFSRLVEAARRGGPVEGLPGPDRAMLYILSAWTGYRRKELDSLAPRSLALDADPPTIRIEAAYAKNGCTDESPLHPDVAALLRAWLAERPDDQESDDRLFPLQTPSGHWRKTSKMMRLDLAAARAAWIEEARTDRERERREASDFLSYEDEAGLFADFHANRHTFITNLGRAGVSLAAAQKLARHSTPALTSNVYTHLELADKAAAIRCLPCPPGAGEPAEIRATGTDNAAATVDSGDSGRKTWYHLGARASGPRGQNRAKAGKKGGTAEEDEGEPQVVAMTGDSGVGQGMARGGESGDERDRTANPRLAKPVLSRLSYVPKPLYCKHLVFPTGQGIGGLTRMALS
jgi:integrase/recombinase XerD